MNVGDGNTVVATVLENSTELESGASTTVVKVEKISVVAGIAEGTKVVVLGGRENMGVVEDRTEDGVVGSGVCSIDVVSGTKLISILELGSMLNDMLGDISITVVDDISVKVVIASLTNGVVVSGVCDTSMEGVGVGVTMGVDSTPELVTPTSEEVGGINSKDEIDSEAVAVLTEGVKKENSLENVGDGLVGVISNVGDGVIVGDCAVNNDELTGSDKVLVIWNIKLEDGSSTVVVGWIKISDDREIVGSCVNVSRRLDEATNIVVLATGINDDVDGNGVGDTLENTPTDELIDG